MMLKKENIIKELLIWMIYLILSIESMNECCFNSSFAFRDNQAILLFDFDRFDQLNFNFTASTEMSALRIHPNKNLILDNSFNLRGNRIQMNIKSVYFLIRFTNLKGIDLDT